MTQKNAPAWLLAGLCAIFMPFTAVGEALGYAVTAFSPAAAGVDEVGFLKVRESPDMHSNPLDQVTAGMSVRLLDEAGDMLYIRVTGTCGYIPSAYAVAFCNEALFSQGPAAYQAANYTVGEDLRAGLYRWSNAPQGGALLQIVLADGSLRKYEGDTRSSFTVFLPEGASVEWREGGSLTPVTGDEDRCPAAPGQVYPPGRYMAGVDLEASPYAEYSLHRLPGREQASFKVSTLLYDAGRTHACESVEIAGGGPTPVYLHEGDFIELNGCVLIKEESNG